MRHLNCFVDQGPEGTKPVHVVAKSALGAWLDGQPSDIAAFVRGSGFNGDNGRVIALPGSEGVAGHLIARGDASDRLWAGSLASSLPEGAYRLEGLSDEDLASAALAWALGAYQFTAYKAAKRAPAKLWVPERARSADVTAMAEATNFVRDLINTPALDMGPDELEAAAREVAGAHDADVTVTKGDDLMRYGLRLIHAVGMGSPRAPRLVDFNWGRKGDPKLTLIGKGVTFDTGGLDIKPSSGMALMKKDMGGAAHALGLAHLIMRAGLKVQLRVLVPIVENSVSGRAFRPGDVFKSHKGLTVEITNTDAEGRLILADAMSVADQDSPDLLVDLATLTGAARSALGPELPAYFTNDDALAAAIDKAAALTQDPCWRLPLWANYTKWLNSSVADLQNSPSGAFAGAIVAALFLKKFVEKAKSWVHFDIYAWNSDNGPARAIGGEAQTLRALFKVFDDRFGRG